MSQNVLDPSETPAAGIRPADLLSLAPEQQSLVRWLLRRREANLTAISDHFKQAPDQVQGLLEPLVQQGLVQQVDHDQTTYYRVRLALKAGRQIPKDVWEILDRKPEVANVFISYSRRDKAFVETFYRALQQQGRSVWVDWESIPLATDWWQEIQQGIDLADTFIAILSPDSVRSQVCSEEIDHAANQHKRLIPIVYRDVNPQEVHPALARLNWIFMRSQDNFETSLQNLLRTLDTDLDYLRQHTRLLVRALEWDRHQRDASYLLRGHDLATAKEFLDVGTHKEPHPTTLQTQYILESARIEAGQRDAEIHRQMQALQHQRIGLTVISLLLAVMTGLGLASFRLFRQAEASRTQADRLRLQTQHLYLKARSRTAEALFRSSQYFDALLEGIRAGVLLENSEELAADPRLRSQIITALQQALFWVREHNRLEGHTGVIWGVSFSPDGRLLASAGADHTVRLWQPDGTPIPMSQQHKSQVTAIVFTPDSQVLASGSDDGQVYLWGREGNLLQSLGEQGPSVTALGATPDGLIVVGRQDGSLQFWRLGKGETTRSQSASAGAPSATLVQTLAAHTAPIRAIQVSADGQLLVSADDSGSIHLRRRSPQGPFPAAPSQRLLGHQGRVSSLSLSLKAPLLASSSWDQTIRLWDLNGRFIRSFEFKDQARQGSNLVHQVQFSPDGQTLAAATADKRVYLWRLDGRLLTTLVGHSAQVRSLSFSPDGHHLASAGGDRVVRLWVLDRPHVVTLQDHQAEVLDANMAPDDQILASASADHTIKLWTREGRLLQTLWGHQSLVWTVDFSPNGQRLVSASSDHTVKIWDRTGKLLKTLTGHAAPVYEATYSPNGQYIASGSEDGTVRLWSASGQPLRTLKGHRQGVLSAAFSPDSQRLASTSWDNTVQLWQLDGTPIAILRGHSGWVLSAAFSPDGQRLATASYDNTAKIWDLNTNQVLVTLEGHTDGVYDVAFHPQRPALATASYDGTIRLWHLDGTLITTLYGQAEGINSIDFSRDGQSLIATGNDRTILIWDLKDFDNLEVLMTRGCLWVQDYLRTNPHLTSHDRQLCQPIAVGADAHVPSVDALWEEDPLDLETP